MSVSKIEYSIPNTHCKVILEVCNLFEQEGLKVIHCHHTFDTDDEVMLGSSVMGQFIKYCKDKQFDLDGEISKWIDKYKCKSAVDESLPCRKNYFNLGELCPIKVDDEQFVLAAFDDLKLFLETGAMEFDSYLSFLDNLWKSFGRLLVLDRSVVNVPAFGNKIVNVANNSFTIDQKIGLIILSYFKGMKESRLFKALRICIYEPDAVNLDLEKWESAILPYLFQFSQLSLGLKTLNSKQKGLFAGIERTIKSYKPNPSKSTNDAKGMVFISHAAEDTQEADIVYQYLEANGYKCWMDIHDITPGVLYANEIMKGFNESSVIVVILSNNTMSSTGVLYEVDHVYKLKKIIIPFRIDDAELSDELSFYLSSTQWVNAFPHFEEHLDDLKKAIKQLQHN